MKKHLKEMLLAFLVLTIVSLVAVAGEAKDLTLVYTGATLGQIQPCPYCRGELGGIARRVRWITDEYRIYKDAVLVDAGNAFYGIPSDNRNEVKERAKILLRLYKEMGYNCVAIGSKDLELPVDFLKRYGEKRGLTLISSNVYIGGERAFKPFIIRRVSGIKIGFIGLTAKTKRGYRGSTGFLVKDPASELGAIVKEVKKRTELTVLLTDLDQITLRRILNGDIPIDIAIVSGNGPRLRKAYLINKTWILSPTERGNAIGVARVLVGDDGKVLSVNNSMISLKGYFPEDKDTKEIVQAFIKKYHITKSVLRKRIRRQQAMENPFLRALMEARKRRASGNGQAASPPNGQNPFMELIHKKTGEKGRDSSGKGVSPTGSSSHP